MQLLGYLVIFLLLEGQYPIDWPPSRTVSTPGVWALQRWILHSVI